MQSSTLSSEFIIKSSQSTTIPHMQKIVFWTLITLSIANIIVSLTIGHFTHYYNPHITASLNGFVASLTAISFLVLLSLDINKHYLIKTKTPVLVTIGLIAILSFSFQFALGFYFGGWGSAIWLLAVIYGYFGKGSSNQSQVIVSMEQHINDTTPEIKNSSVSQTLIQKPTCSSKCCDCCYFACLTITLIVMALFGSISITYFANWNQYGVYGQLIEVKLPENDWTVNVQAYCVGQPQLTRPTIVLQHGGGSNSIAFLELGQALSASSWHLCAYDRLGYGRSSIIPRYLSLEQKAFISNAVINQLLKNQPNQNIIIGGWSAGVQISQIYTKLYPNNVKGMVFLDGYPDYLLLDAICKNLSEPLNSPAIAVTEILRFITPFGADFIVGASPIKNSTVSSYYRAYYQTGYFWQSQYFDLVNPLPKTTDWLTKNDGNSSVPYPNSSIPLNWPDITVPLIVMPANETVYGGAQCGTMYLTQSQKYIDKCSNTNKLIKIMPGKHQFVIEYPGDVANEINSFFAALF